MRETDVGNEAGMGDLLETYRRKRDFARTPEPAGAVAEPGGGERRFVVQRHRARRLHYDLRLEIDGVLVSWAVPKGPTLDPTARRLAVHVEDHPLEYFDFEGVIPAGEYGGGDVIVWDWGTWEPRDRPTTRSRPSRAGELHVDLHGEKLRGRFVLVRTRPATARQGAVAAAAQARRARRRRAGTPRTIPRSVRQRPHQRRGRRPTRTGCGARTLPAAERRRVAAARPCPTSELAALDDARRRRAPGRCSAATLQLTNLDKVLFPAAATASRRSPSATCIRYAAQIAPAMLPYLADRPLNLHRYPDGVDDQGLLAQGSCPSHAPDWLPRWDNDDADPGETETYLVVDEPAALAWAANFGALECTPGRRGPTTPHQPTWALIDIDPGERRPAGTTCWCWPGCTAPRSSTSASRRARR